MGDTSNLPLSSLELANKFVDYFLSNGGCEVSISIWPRYTPALNVVKRFPANLTEGVLPRYEGMPNFEILEYKIYLENIAILFRCSSNNKDYKVTKDEIILYLSYLFDENRDNIAITRWHSNKYAFKTYTLQELQLLVA